MIVASLLFIRLLSPSLCMDWKDNNVQIMWQSCEHLRVPLAHTSFAFFLSFLFCFFSLRYFSHGVICWASRSAGGEGERESKERWREGRGERERSREGEGGPVLLSYEYLSFSWPVFPLSPSALVPTWSPSPPLSPAHHHPLPTEPGGRGKQLHQSQIKLKGKYYHVHLSTYNVMGTAKRYRFSQSWDFLFSKHGYLLISIQSSKFTYSVFLYLFFLCHSTLLPCGSFVPHPLPLTLFSTGRRKIGIEVHCQNIFLCEPGERERE